MGGIAGDELNFDGLDFVWNPEDGDLMLVLEILPPPRAGAGGGMMSLASERRTPPSSRSAAARQNASGGDETSPSDGDKPPNAESAAVVSPVPEPASWALMIAGFGLGGAALRQRRGVIARA
jgi:hypothetical protein